MKNICNYTMVCAGGPAGGGRNELSPRFLRHFHIFHIPDPSTNLMTFIFSKILGSFLEKDFHETVRKATDCIVTASIEAYQKVSLNLKPTPSKFHYSYNLRDVSKVFQGLLMTSPKAVPTLEHFAKL